MNGAGHRESTDDRGPIEVWDEPWTDRLTWAFVVLGVAIRLIRFLSVHPLWGDECFVAANLIDKGYADLFGPMDYQQVAPPLFLGLELLATRLLGFSEASLRVFPTLAAILSLILFRHLASRVARGIPMMLAVAVVAVATNPIRHGGEAKPYAFDFLASTVLVTMAVEWWRRPERSAWIWGLAAVMPFAIGLSFPAVFVASGISLAIFPVGSARADPARSNESRPAIPRILAYLVFNASILVSFLAISAVNSGDRAAGIQAYMDHYWSGFFLPHDGLVSALQWLVLAHTGDLLAYPVGGPRGASLVSAVCVAVASVALWRRGRSMIVMLTLAPLGLALVASAFRRYPYGENERIMQFAGPMLCLMVGMGASFGLVRLRNRRNALMAILALLGAIGVGSMVSDVVLPAKTMADLRTREFYRWFWAEAGHGSDLVCARVDLGLDFEPGPSHHGRSADYLTYQRIFAGPGRPIDCVKLSNARPLRCVIYDGLPVDSALFDRWMGKMNGHYRLVKAETYWSNSGLTGKSVSSTDHLVVLEFLPIGDPVDPVEVSRSAVKE